MILNLITFTFYPLFLLLSTLGYGIIFNHLIFNKSQLLNLSLVGFFGLYLIYFISSFTHLFVPHNYLHNIIVHLVGLILFFYFRKKIDRKELKLILIFFIILFLGFFISKTNEDFPFYHLPLSLHLAEQKLQFGLGNLNFAYNHWSSLFLLNSLYYLPIVKIYLFNLPNFFIQVFFFSGLVMILLDKKIPLFSTILSSFVFIVFITKFNRLAEYGVDFAGQFLVTLGIILCSIGVLKNKKNNENKSLFLFEISFILMIFAITTKVLYSIYILIPLVLLFYNFRFKKIVSYFLKFRFIFISSLGIITFVFFNFVTSGCLVYPISGSCFYNEVSWTMKEETINHLRTHYNAWSKGGIVAGNLLPEGVNSIENYVSSLYWIKNWFKVYFFTKVSDFLLLIVFIKLLFIIIFKKFFLNKNQISHKDIKLFRLLYILILIVFLIWFLNFPTLRYAGYSIVSLSLAIPFCFFVSYNIKLNNKEVRKRYTYLMILSIIVFNLRNIDRINNEFSLKINENHNFSNFPFYWVKKTEYKKKQFFNTLTSGGSCWSTPSVCYSGDGINVQSKNGYLIYISK